MLELTAAGLQFNGSTNLIELGPSSIVTSAARDGPSAKRQRTDVTHEPTPELEDEAARWRATGWIEPDPADDHRTAPAAMGDFIEATTTVIEAFAAAASEEWQ